MKRGLSSFLRIQFNHFINLTNTYNWIFTEIRRFEYIYE